MVSGTFYVRPDNLLFILEQCLKGITKAIRQCISVPRPLSILISLDCVNLYVALNSWELILPLSKTRCDWSGLCHAQATLSNIILAVHAVPSINILMLWTVYCYFSRTARWSPRFLWHASWRLRLLPLKTLMKSSVPSCISFGQQNLTILRLLRWCTVCLSERTGALG